MRTTYTTRTREFTALQSTPANSHVTTTYLKGGGIDYTRNDGLYAYAYTPQSKEFHDVVTPAFARKRNEGQVIINDKESHTMQIVAPVVDYTVTQMRWTPSQVFRRRNFSGCFSNLVSDGWSFGTVNSQASIDAAINRALTSVYGKMSEAEVLGLVSLAEMHKTMGTVQRVFGEVLWWMQKGVSIKRKLLRGHITLEQAANLWLEIRYGLRPLYYDIKGCAAALGRLNDSFERLRFDATEYVDGTWESPVPISWYTSNPAYPSGVRMFNCKTVVRAGVLIEPRIDGIPPDVFGLKDIVPSLWEVVPFSFIVDWFLNTGSYFAGLNPTVNVGYLGSWVTVDTETVRRQTVNLVKYDAGLSYEGSAYVSGLYEERTYKDSFRYAYPDKPALPQLDIRLSWSKFIDILALLKALCLSDALNRWKI
jgi:hypothetical protein